MNEIKLLKARQAADLLNISPQQLYRLSWARKLSRVKIGGGYRWPLAEIEKYIKQNTEAATK